MRYVLNLLMSCILLSLIACGGGSSLPAVDDSDSDSDSESSSTTITVSLGASPATIFEISSRNVQIGADIDGVVAGELAGSAAVLSGDGSRLALSAVSNDEVTANAGQVRVYELSGSTWTQIGSDINGETQNDYSGSTLSLSTDGSILAIGADSYDGVAGFDSGYVRVFEFTNNEWSQLGADIEGEAANDFSADSMALSSDGTILAIGAYLNDGAADNAGHVRVYEYNGTAWIQLGQDIDGEAAADFSGKSVALSSDGHTLAIGAIFNDGAALQAGHVRVYAYNTGSSTWVQVGNDIDGESESDLSGMSVDLSSDGTIVAIVASEAGGDNRNGQVRVFELVGSTWTQVGSDLDGDESGDELGQDVALSADGSVLVVASGLSGYVRVHRLVDGEWVQHGETLLEEADGDSFGGSLSLSDDGSMLSVGASANDGAGSDAGHVRVFDLQELSIVSTVTATISQAASSNVVVTLAATGTASGESVDYTLSSTTITIAQGDTTATASVTALTDASSDDDETVILDISEVTGAEESSAQQVTITIDEG